MTKYISTLKILSLMVIIFAVVLFSPGCGPKPPGPEVIEKAKMQTNAILDSLEQTGTMIISDVKLNSEAFYEDDGKYIINYEISSGLDSSHITTTQASVFLIPDKGVWVYNFIFDQTYERVISME